jgi:hypothetical protein
VLFLEAAAAIHFAREYFVNEVERLGAPWFSSAFEILRGGSVANKSCEAARSHHRVLRLAPSARLVRERMRPSKRIIRF